MLIFAPMFKSFFIRGSILAVLILIDLYVFQAIKATAEQRSVWMQKAIYIIFWGISLFTILIVIMSGFVDFYAWPKAFRQYAFGIIATIYLSKLVVLPFLMIDDVIRVFTWLISLFGSNKTGVDGLPMPSSGGISRIRFLSYLGVGLASIPFLTLMYGMLYGKYQYRVRRLTLKYPQLPSGFDGIRIVQFSDFHIGSFMSPEHVEKAISLINAQNPDLILFTGDLVNDRASEVEEFKSIIKKLHAPMGIYSILGNHDYGDYFQWENMEQKRDNMERLKLHQKEMGWTLLLNENLEINIKEQKISLIGVENWSAVGRFPKYGNLKQAMNGVDPSSFQILLSHDPSHWQAEVVPEFPGIHLTLSGHTHGMQFGVEIPGFKWSPVQYVYKFWAGLYNEGKQHLYVNRGLGFIGYPGRVGILPEITVFELKA
jgi:predicted MPP superfamily phosphohydrolase